MQLGYVLISHVHEQTKVWAWSEIMIFSMRQDREFVELFAGCASASLALRQAGPT